MRHPSRVALLVLAASCGPAVEPVPEYPVGGLHAVPRDQVRALGRVEADDCRELVVQPRPTEERARLAVRRRAAETGASGVIAVRCEYQGFGDGCWDRWVCTGDAFRIEPPR
jgi:uncharacterized protein YbjQ (UPF0145 family)